MTGAPRFKRLKLAGLALIGLSTVSIPLTIAFVLSATGSSDVLVVGELKPTKHHASPAKAVARLRCVATRGYYALTFDDGPSPATTPKLVATLRASKAVATFFDIGRQAAAHPDLVELERGVGQVANHTYSHPRFAQVSQARRLQELQMGAKALDYPNAFFRPPYGETGPDVEADVRATGLTTVYWTVDVRDQGLGADAIAKQALTVEPGGIVRLHEGVATTIEAIPSIVAGLQKRGMCSGFLGATPEAVSAPGGTQFHAVAVKP